MSTDFTGMIAFAQSLAETVKQAQTATEELAVARSALAEAASALDTMRQARDDWRTDSENAASAIRDLCNERDALQRQNAEVSEALARANAKLNSFRELLGVDSGQAAPEPSGDVQSAQPDRPEPAHAPQHVEAEPAGGTGGVEPSQAAALSEGWRANDPYAGQTLAGEPFSDVDASKSEPTQSPEVAEPRPTPSANLSPGESGGSGTQHGDSWRDSASHVPYYRAFAS